MTTPNGDGPIIRQFGESSEQQVKGHMVLWSAHTAWKTTLHVFTDLYSTVVDKNNESQLSECGCVACQAHVSV